jgi:hypothetical protein
VATFTLAARNARVDAQHDELVRRLEHEAADVSGTDDELDWQQDPVDLRRIPAIGRSVSGAIPHTQPESALLERH